MRTITLAVALVLTGCVVTTYSNVDTTMSAESAKLRMLDVGMTIEQVERIMGVDPIELKVWNDYGEFRSLTVPRPAKIHRFQAKDGKRVAVFYYISRNNGISKTWADDETTAVVFVDGKLDAMLPGETSKEVIEVRFR